MTEKCKRCLQGYPSIDCVDCDTGFRNYTPYTPPSNADRIRGMSDEELAKELTRNPPIPCRKCEYYDHKLSCCYPPNDFVYVTAYAEALTLDWLQSPAEMEGME